MRTLTTFVIGGLTLLGILFNSCRHEPILPPGTPDVFYKEDIQKSIIDPRCNISGCHGSGEAPELNNYPNVSHYVTAFKPMESKLYKVITAHSSLGNLMPPKPEPPLNRTQIDMISKWILQGAKDN